MKIKSVLVLLGVAVGCVAGQAQTTAAGTTPPATNALVSEVMPLIVISDAPLPDAIGNLARQAGINIQFDPKVLTGGPDPKNPNATLPPPNVTFHWENVTPMQALYALLENYSLQIVQDPKSKISRITTKSPDALEPLVPRIITLRYSQSQVTNLIPMVKAVAGTRGQVMADVRTGQLLVLATEKDLLAVEELITKLDISPTQILIETRFMETVKNPKSAKGVNWSGTLASHNLAFGNTFTDYYKGLEPRAPTADKTIIVTDGNGLPTASYIEPGDRGFAGVPNRILGRPQMILDTHNGFGPVGFLNSDGLSAVISFLNSDNQTETISTPRTVALEGVPTEIAVVQNIPIFEEKAGNIVGSTILPNTVGPNYELRVDGTVMNEVGIKLLVTPRVYGSSNVFLDLKPEISERGADLSVTLGGRVNTAPTFLRKKIRTQALVPSTATLVLGGLQEDRNSKVSTKVPILGDIPALGRAFRSDTKEKNKRQLLIFVTPTILGADDYIINEESSDFLHQKGIELPETPWSSYDSAAPKDWTKPLE